MCHRLRMSLVTVVAVLSLIVTGVIYQTSEAAASGMTEVKRGSNGTALLVGGTSQPSGKETAHLVGMRSVPPGARWVAVQTTAQFAPVSGLQSYDDSKRDGARRIVRAIKATPGQKTLIVYSLSTVSADIALRQLRREGYDTSNLTVVKVSNARRDGTTKGIETVFSTFAVPGITSGGAEARTGVRTVDYCLQYDPVCDAPRAGSPPESYINAVMCYFECHSNYGSRAMRGRSAVVEQRGNTTYVTYRNKAPLTARTGIYVPDSLERTGGARPAVAPAEASTPVQAVAPVTAPVVQAPVYVPPQVQVPVVTQAQVQQVTQQVVQAVPQAAPVVEAIASHPVVEGFLKGLPR
ncbi:MAG: PE-PPE domain-containing protein [Candidatus Saccharimonadales bacterium]